MGGGEGVAHSKTTHSVCILTLKAVTIKTVDSQAHFSGDPKSYAQNGRTSKNIHLSEDKKNQNLKL